MELEPEVADWLGGLDDQRWAQAMFHMDLLEQRGVLPGERECHLPDDEAKEGRRD